MYKNTAATTLLVFSLSILFLRGVNTQCTGDYLTVRSLDGTCNNLNDPTLGSKATTFARTQEGFHYTETTAPFQTAVTAGRPNTRDVSNILLDNDNGPLTSTTCNRLSLLHSSFGQFLFHDLGSSTRLPLPFIPFPGDPTPRIRIPILDPTDTFLFILGTNGQVPKSLIIQPAEIRAGISITTLVDGVKDNFNGQTHFMDLSTIYWRDQQNLDAFRTFVDGKFILEDYTHTSTYNAANTRDTTSNPETRTTFNAMPSAATTGTPIDFESHAIDPLDQIPAAGDERVAENGGLLSVNQAFYVEHNTIAAEVKTAHPTWTDEQIFQKARTINTAKFQYIVYNEWIPYLFGDLQVARYLGKWKAYDPTVDPRESVLVSGAAGRYGHSTIIDKYPTYDQCANPDPTGGWSGNLIQALQNGGPTSPIRIISGAGGMEGIMRSLVYTPMEDIDHLVLDDMRDINIGVPFLSGVDIPAINMERGRVNGIPDFSIIYDAWNPLVPLPGDNDLYSQNCPSTASSPGTDDLACWESWMQEYDEIPNFASDTRTVYDKLIHLDAWFGLVAERNAIGSNLGRTASRILLDQFRRSRDGDRFWFENLPNLGNVPGTGEPPLTAAELADVKTTSLAKILRRSYPDLVVPNSPFTVPREEEQTYASCFTASRFVLKDGTTTVKEALYSGNVVDLNNVPSEQFLVQTDLAGANLQSVKIDFDVPGASSTSRTFDATAPGSVTFPLSAILPSACQAYTLPNTVTITATPFDGAGALGNPGEKLVRQLTVTGDLSFAVTGFKLFDSVNNVDKGNLCDNDVVSLSGHIPGGAISIEADVAGAESVAFYVNNVFFRTENQPGYFIAGNSGSDVFDWTSTPGTYTIRAVPYDVDAASTSQLPVGNAGLPLEVTITVVA